MQKKVRPYFSHGDIHGREIDTHIERITHELREGFSFLRKFPKSVTIFGSSVAVPESPGYQNAEKLAGRICRELGYAVVTGGGPGIMEAANKGAQEAKGVSVGIRITLPSEHSTNPYVGESSKFNYFFTRKAMLTFAAEVYIFFPGGYGTLDELFSTLTLIQTGKIPSVPVILFDSKFWNPLRLFMMEKMMADYRAIGAKDVEMFEITDSLDHIIDIIRKAPVSEWWRHIN